MPEFRPVRADVRPPGLFSQSQIRHLMRIEFSRAQRYRYPLACLVLAVDRLGHLRDLYGYEAKEDVVRELVKLLHAETRVCDYLGRLVDDRLMAVLPHTPPAGARSSAERLLAGARKIEFQADGRAIELTLSIGGSHFEGDNTLFFDALLESAEAAAREAEAAGGDRFVHREPGFGDA
jgi:diguanylate cyclase (GGDEF)-like protein